MYCVCIEVWCLFLYGGSALCWSVRVCLPSGAKEEGGWTVGFHEVVKECVRKYGHNCERLSWKTDDERFTTFATLTDCRTELAKEYCRMSSTCGALQQNLCQRLTALRLTRRSFCCCFGLLRIRQSSPIDPTHRTPPLNSFSPR